MGALAEDIERLRQRIIAEAREDLARARAGKASARHPIANAQAGPEHPLTPYLRAAATDLAADWVWMIAEVVSVEPEFVLVRMR